MPVHLSAMLKPAQHPHLPLSLNKNCPHTGKHSKMEILEQVLRVTLTVRLEIYGLFDCHSDKDGETRKVWAHAISSGTWGSGLLELPVMYGRYRNALLDLARASPEPSPSQPEPGHTDISTPREHPAYPPLFYRHRRTIS